MASPEPWPLERAPIPNIIPLQGLAKMRLAAGLRAEVEMVVALQDVRHLAQLTKDGEGDVAFMVAVAMLGMERKAYERAVALGRMDPGDWETVAEQDIKLGWRAFRGLAAVYSGEAPAGSSAKMEALGPRIARCGALYTGLMHGSREQ